MFSILLFLLIIFYFISPYLFTQEPPNYDEFKSYLTSLENTSNEEQQVERKIELRPFNPNVADREELLLTGLSEKQVATIINYREKIGNFKSIDDFKKVYGISKETFAKLTPYIYFNDDLREEKEEKEVEKLFNPFPFNPNNISKDEMEKIGFNDKQISQIINFREKGGRFYDKTDFKKIYAISESDYNQLEEYLLIDEAQEKIDRKTDSKLFTIDINQAEALEFQQIKGIGEKISARIIKYRDLLGGFYSINQLKEVYSIESDLIENNKAHFKLNKSQIAKLNINKLEMEDLAKHPYLNFNQSRIIVNYRKVHGLFTTVDEIKSNNLLKEEEYSKIVPYLTID